MMDADAIFGTVLQRAQQSADATQAPEDYIEGGLLHCGKCHTKKQAVIEFGRQDVVVPVLCECAQKAYNAEREFEKQRQHYFSVMQKYDWCELHVNAKREHVHPAVLQYLEKWDAMLESGVGLLLWGNVGTGKTVSAAYVVNELKKRYIPAIITNFAQFGDIKTDLPNFSRVDLLVLDDLGAERTSSWMLERVFEIVDSRTRCGKPTIYTTNLRLEDLKNPRDTTYRRLYSRVLERAVPILFSGDDHRRENAQSAIKAMRELLGG